MERTCHIAIIGAGPAGLCAARNILLQSNPPSIILIEKNDESNKHIPCAEGVGKLGFHEIMEPKSSWIRSVVSKATFHSPDGTTITYTDKNKGYIINRLRMQKDLTKFCMDRGATVLFGHIVKKISGPDIKGKRRLFFFDNTSVSAKVIIDCSGPLTRFGKDEGFDCKPSDLETAYFAYIENVKAQSDTVHIYVGENIAPGGYAWAFPHGKECLNVGIVIGSSFRGKVNIGKLLSSFIQSHFPQGEIGTRCSGSIPCYNKKFPIATVGLIKAGDTISTVNPISRAGISEAMKSGTIAGTYAIKMLKASSEKEIKKICKEYTKVWHEKLGKKHLKLARVKKSLQKVPDNDYDKGAHALANIPQNKLTMSKIFTLCLGKFPKLILALRYLI